jgi:hypothetical protein
MDIVDAIGQRDSARAVQLVRDYHGEVVKRFQSSQPTRELLRCWLAEGEPGPRHRARPKGLKDTVGGECTTAEDVPEAVLFLTVFNTNALTGRSLVVSHGWFTQ